MLTGDNGYPVRTSLFCSSDGVHMKPVGPVPFLDTTKASHMTLDSQNVLFFDTRVSKYVIYARFNQPSTQVGNLLRTFERSESDQLGGFMAFTLALTPDAQDPAGFDFYTTAAIQYPYAAGAHFMFPAGG